MENQTPRDLYVCENCGRLAPIRAFDDECRPGWTHGRLIPVRSTTIDPFLNDAQHPTWADYLATNLHDALTLVPDTGDWHGALRMWCERTMSGTLKPNRNPAS